MQTTHGGPATTKLRPETAKPALRALFRERRQLFVSGLTPAARESLERDLARVIAPLTALPAARAAPVASYASIGAEIDPQFAEAAFGPHAFPRIDGPDLHFHVAAWADLLPGPMGIPQPRADAPEITPRLLLVPLLAATPTGLRLGQGGGYYDRLLARLRATAPTIAVGLAWDCQITDMLPAEPHDQQLDWIATPSRLVECTRVG